MSTKNNQQKIEAIKKLIENFCDANLNQIYKAFIMNLFDAVSRNKSFKISRGKNEAWAASCIHAIACLNFLYDNDNNSDGQHITFDALCDFFQMHKTTIRSRAKQIAKACDIRIGQPEYSNSDIMDIDTFFEKENRLKINKSTSRERLDKEIVLESANEEEFDEIERFMDEQQRLVEEKLQKKKARRLEINRMIAEKKKAKKEESAHKQLKLF
jgi:hypothetical protein